MMRRIPAAILTAAVAVGCSMEAGAGDSGVMGTVTVVSGNCMPRIAEDASPTGCDRRPVATRIIVRDPVPLGRTDPDHQYLVGPAEPPRAEGRSDAEGAYDIALPPGRYSVFAEDGGKEYCAVSDGAVMCPVSVGEGERTRYEITINHAVW